MHIYQHFPNTQENDNEILLIPLDLYWHKESIFANNHYILAFTLLEIHRKIIIITSIHTKMIFLCIMILLFYSIIQKDDLMPTLNS